MHQIVFRLGRRTRVKGGKGRGRYRREGWRRKWRGGYVYRRKRDGRKEGKGKRRKKGRKEEVEEEDECCLKLFRGPAETFMMLRGTVPPPHMHLWTRSLL